MYERVRISLVEVYKKGWGDLTDEFYGFKMSKKRSIFVIDSYLKDSALYSNFKGAKF